MLERTKKELELLEKSCEDEDGVLMQKLITSNVLELMEVLNNQGHSGFSVNYVLNLFNKCVKGEPLAPLTGEDSEWEDVSYFHVPDNHVSMQQNLRCSRVFRFDGDNATAHCNDVKVFSDDGEIWYTSNESSVPLVFPCYLPPTEYIDLSKNLASNE